MLDGFPEEGGAIGLLENEPGLGGDEDDRTERGGRSGRAGGQVKDDRETHSRSPRGSASAVTADLAGFESPDEVMIIGAPEAAADEWEGGGGTGGSMLLLLLLKEAPAPAVGGGRWVVHELGGGTAPWEGWGGSWKAAAAAGWGGRDMMEWSGCGCKRTRGGEPPA